MGMDGLSMANTGRLKEATSLDYSKESEELAKEDTEKSMIVQELTQQERVNEEKEENRKRRKRSEREEANSDDEEESQEDEFDEDEHSPIPPDEALLLDGENKGFYTKLSKNLENIELYDRITDRLIGTITPEELSSLISKLNMGSGIFINKKV